MKHEAVKIEKKKQEEGDKVGRKRKGGKKERKGKRTGRNMEEKDEGNSSPGLKAFSCHTGTCQSELAQALASGCDTVYTAKVNKRSIMLNVNISHMFQQTLAHG